MKNLIQLATALVLLVHSIGYSQANSESSSVKQATITSTEKAKTAVSTDELQSFIGVYFLEEGDFELEIIEKDNNMYIVSPFSTDILVPKNATTLFEPTRGVDLELIANDNSALKFTQNGYVTTIKRVKS